VDEDASDAMLLGRGVALSSELAGELGLAEGDELAVLAGTREVTLEVAVVYTPERFASAFGRVILCDVALAQELAGSERLDRVELRPRHAGKLDLDALAARARTLLPAGYRIGPVSDRREEGERMVRALEFNLTALSGVSLLVGIVLVATTLATSIVQRHDAIALLRSLGASRGQLAGAVLFEAGTIGLFGGGLGVLLGWGGALAALGSVRTTVATVASDVLPGTVELEPRWILLGLACGLLSALFAAFLPLREALRVPPIQGLRSEHPESVAQRTFARRFLALAVLVALAVFFASLPPAGDRPFGALVSALLILASLLVLSAPLIDLCSSWRPGLHRAAPLRVAQAAVEAGRRRAAWATGAVGVAVGLAISMATMIGSFRQTVVDWTEQTMRSDLFLRPLPTTSGVSPGRVETEVIELARSLFGPDSVDAFRASDAYVDGQPVQLAGADLAVAARHEALPFLGSRSAAEVFAEVIERGGAVVNEPFARRFDRWRGDTLELETPAGPITREVRGVYRDYSGHTGRVVLDRPDFLALYPDEGAESLAIHLPTGTDARDARRRLLAAAAGRFAVDVLLNAEVRSEVLEVFEQTFAVTIALQLIAAAVAGIAVVTVLGALVQERRGELAVLRVLGGSSAQIAGVVFSQALLLGLAGALGGLMVGLLVGYLLVAVVNVQSFGWTLEFLVPWSSLTSTLGIVLAACMLAGLAPAVLSLRRTPQEDLRELG
jgi:putative ABC transport system permease protein